MSGVDGGSAEVRESKDWWPGTMLRQGAMGCMGQGEEDIDRQRAQKRLRGWDGRLRCSRVERAMWIKAEANCP